MFLLWVSYDQLKAIDTSLEFISFDQCRLGHDPTWRSTWPRKEELLSALPEQKVGKPATPAVTCAKTDVENPMVSA